MSSFWPPLYFGTFNLTHYCFYDHTQWSKTRWKVLQSLKAFKFLHFSMIGTLLDYFSSKSNGFFHLPEKNMRSLQQKSEKWKEKSKKSKITKGRIGTRHGTPGRSALQPIVVFSYSSSKIAGLAGRNPVPS